MIRRRLVGAIVGLLAVVLAVTGVLVIGSLRDRLLSDVDQRLDARVSELARGPLRFPGPPRGGVDSPLVEQRAAFIRLDEAGNVLAAIPSGRSDAPEPLPDVSGLPASKEPTTVGSVGGHGPRYRVETVSLPRGRLVAAISLQDVDTTVRNAAHVLLIGGLVALLAAAAAVWGTVRRGLRPIDDMIGTAQRIADGHLDERAPVADPSTEIGHLGTALNTMLDRIEDAVGAKVASEARLRRFVADASHELRTPLTSIRGYAELYRQGADDPESVALGMDRIEREATRMGALVEDLLLLARLDQGHALRAEPVDLAAVAADAVDAARVVDPDRPITSELPSGAGLVTGDPARLRQVVDNLLANVREHTPAGTALDVRLTGDDHTVRLVVADAGPGMSEDEAARAFERFWQAPPTIAHPRRGTGLGLAIVHDLVAGHGGAVDLATAPGSGTMVTVSIPRDPGPRADSGPIPRNTTGSSQDEGR